MEPASSRISCSVVLCMHGKRMCVVNLFFSLDSFQEASKLSSSRKYPSSSSRNSITLANNQHLHQHHPELAQFATGIPGSSSACTIDSNGYYHHNAGRRNSGHGHGSGNHSHCNKNGNITVYATLDKSYLKSRRAAGAASASVSSTSSNSAENGNYSTCSLSRRTTLNHSKSCPLKHQQDAHSTSTNTTSVTPISFLRYPRYPRTSGRTSSFCPPVYR